jgi:hypothetical protein
MEQRPHRKNMVLLGAIVVILACGVSGVVFAAWVNNGPQILLSLGSSALAWCF